jgi:hypothetical protein
VAGSLLTAATSGQQRSPSNDARPKTLRWEIFHAPGRLVYRSRRRIVRLLEGWPSAGVLLGAYQRLALLT